MEPTNLNRLIQQGGISLNSDGISLKINPLWIIDGENRASYITLVRLVECCREHHWNKDILLLAQDSILDTITKSISCEFLQPILSGENISIIYRINEVRSKGYSMTFLLQNLSSNVLCATVYMTCIFYDSISNKSIFPPQSVYEYLLKSLEQ